MRKLKRRETTVVAMFVPIALALLLVYAIVVHSWLGGATVGGTDIYDLAMQISVIFATMSLSIYLILRYAGEEDFWHGFSLK